MFFRTPGECSELARGFGWDEASLGALQSLPATEPGSLALSFEHSLADSFQLAHAIAQQLPELSECVLWVKEYGIWTALDNRHLYYRVRQSYGDRRSITDAPGHEFVKHEYVDLVMFLELTIRLGWGAVVFASRPQAACFISHDGWIKFSGLPDADETARTLKESQFFTEMPAWTTPAAGGPH